MLTFAVSHCNYLNAPCTQEETVAIHTHIAITANIAATTTKKRITQLENRIPHNEKRLRVLQNMDDAFVLMACEVGFQDTG